MLLDPARSRPWVLLSLVLSLAGCSQAPVQPSSPAMSFPAAATAPAPRLASEPLAVQTRDVDYLQVDGKTFQATIYQPEGTGPFPAILDVHGGNWVREDVRRDEHALMNKALAAMGIVVVAIDFRQSPQHHYPDSVADVHFALRWLRANASRFNASPHAVGVFGSSSGGHLVLLSSMRSSDPRYAALPLPGIAPDSATPDYIILAYPMSDPLGRRAYNQQAGNNAVLKGFDIYFSPPGSLQEGNPQLILERCEPVNVPPVLLLQGTADGNGPEMQQRFAAAYQAAGGKLQLELLPGAPHNFVNTAGVNVDRALALVKAFIGQRLAGQ